MRIEVEACVEIDAYWLKFLSSVFSTFFSCFLKDNSTKEKKEKLACEFGMC